MPPALGLAPRPTDGPPFWPPGPRRPARPLSETELAYARRIFRDSLAYDRVRLTIDHPLSFGAPKVIGFTIHLRSDWGDWEGEALGARGLHILIHELVHVWQYQHGGWGYAPRSLAAQLRAWWKCRDRSAAYRWRGPHSEGLLWSRWNPEQQAQLVEDVDATLEAPWLAEAAKDHALAPLWPYIQQLRRAQGVARGWT